MHDAANVLITPVKREVGSEDENTGALAANHKPGTAPRGGVEWQRWMWQTWQYQSRRHRR